LSFYNIIENALQSGEKYLEWFKNRKTSQLLWEKINKIVKQKYKMHRSILKSINLLKEKKKNATLQNIAIYNLFRHKRDKFDSKNDFDFNLEKIV